MAEAPSHIILSQVFDVQCSDDYSPRDVQDAFSRVQRNTLERVIGEVLDEFEESGVYMRAGTVQLDIGPVRYDHLDEDLSEKVRQQLRNTLQMLVDQGSVDRKTAGPALKRETSADIAYRTFEHFLLQGTMPWWAQNRTSVDEAFDSLLESSPDRMSNLVKDIGRKDFVRKRIVHQFDDRRISALVRVLEPVEGDFIVEYATYLQQRHEREPVAQVDSAQFRDAKWEFILAYLLLERGSRFNKKEFVRSLIQKLAARYTLDYIGFLTYLESSATGREKGSIKAPLYQILLELITEARAGIPGIADRPAGIAEQGDGRTNLADERQNLLFVNHYLRFGTVPWWSAVRTKKEAEELVMIWWHNKPSQAREVYYRWVTALAQQTRRNIFLPPAFVEQLMATVPGAPRARLKRVYETLRHDMRQLPGNTGELDSSELLELWLLTSVVFKTTSPTDEALRQYMAEAWFAIRSQTAFTVEGAAEQYAPSREVQLLRESYYHVLAQPVSESLRTLVMTLARKAGIDKGQAAVFPDSQSLANVIAGWKHTYNQYSGKPKNVLLAALKDELFRLAYERRLPYFDLLLALRHETTDHQAFGSTDKELVLELIREAIRVRTLINGRGKTPQRGKEHEEVPSRVSDPGQAQGFARDPFERELEVIIYYIRHRRLPWWAGDLEPQGLVARMEKLHREEASKFIAALRLVISSPELRKGLLHPGITDEFFLRLVALLDTSSMRVVDMAYRVAMLIHNQITPGKKLPPGWQGTIRELALGSLLFAEHMATEEEFANLWLEWLNLETGVSRSDLLQWIEGHRDSMDALLPRQRNILGSWLGALAAADAAMNKAEEKSTTRAAVPGKNTGKHLLTEEKGQEAVYGQAGVPASSGVALALHPRRLAILITFLRTGTVPAAYGSFSRHEQLAFLDAMARTHPGAVLQLLRNPRMREYFLHTVQQEPQAVHTMKILLGGQYGGAASMTVREMLIRLAHPHLSADRRQAFERFIDMQLLVMLAHEGASLHHDTLFRWVSLALNQLGRHSSKPLAELTADLRASLQERPAAERELLTPHLDHLVQSLNTWIEKTEAAEKAGFPGKASGGEKTTASGEGPDAEEEDTPSTEPVFVENAGLVLLWPFLSTCFQRVNLMSAGKFKDNESAYRAVHLLHFLATGEEAPPEYRLTLNKLLCGVKTAKPVLKNLQLSPEEKEVCEALLKAVTQQWEPLRNTSVNGLREAFLQRNGRLETEDERYLLRVEKKAYDMLLDKLPWSIGMIKTSWMEKVIYVEWR